MSKENNVIDFPGKKKKSPRQNGESRSLIFDLENNKLMVSGSLASILVIMTLLNTSVFSTSSQLAEVGTKNDRSIASVSQQNRHTKWEHKLAKSLNKEVTRGIASIGREPSSKEKFRIGELEGKYSVNFAGERIKSLQFIKGSDDADQPKYITDRQEFLSRNRHLLPIDYSRISLEKTVAVSNGQNEVYRLVSTDRRSHVDVKFELDQYDRLISMTVSQ